MEKLNKLLGYFGLVIIRKSDLKRLESERKEYFNDIQDLTQGSVMARTEALMKWDIRNAVDQMVHGIITSRCKLNGFPLEDAE